VSSAEYKETIERLARKHFSGATFGGWSECCEPDTGERWEDLAIRIKDDDTINNAAERFDEYLEELIKLVPYPDRDLYRLYFYY